MSKLPAWRTPDNFKRAPHQAIVDILNELYNLGGDFNTENTPFGRALLDRRLLYVTPQGMPVKVIEALGPDGLYGVRLGLWKSPVSETATVAVADLFYFPDTAGYDAVLMLPDEYYSGGHALAVDDIVIAELRAALSDKGRPVMTLVQGGGTVPQGENQGDVLQMLTDNALGFGPVQIIPER